VVVYMLFFDLRGRRKYKLLSVGLLSAFFLALLLSPVWLSSNHWLSVTAGSIKKIPIYSVEKTESVIAISFDASWGAEHTEELLNILDEYNVKTTFFLVNIWLEDYADMAKKIVARGHEIGLHSVTHPHFSHLSEAQMKEELLGNYQMILDTTGFEAKLFRAPFGEYNNTLLEVAESLGFVTIQWNVDSLDWKDLSAADIQERVLKRIKPGDIVLFHNNGAHTAAALPGILEHLQAEGYSIVPISELLLQGNTYVDYNGVQKQLK